MTRNITLRVRLYIVKAVKAVNVTTVQRSDYLCKINFLFLLFIVKTVSPRVVQKQVHFSEHETNTTVKTTEESTSKPFIDLTQTEQCLTSKLSRGIGDDKTCNCDVITGDIPQGWARLLLICAVAEGRPQNGELFSFLRSFGGSLEILFDKSIPEKNKRREFTVAGV